MADTLTNRASFTLGAAITSATQASITRTSATDGLPGDSNGPASGTYVCMVTDGAGNYELFRVTGGQGTTTLTIARAVEAIGGTQTALASVPNGTVCYAIMPASYVQPASYDETVLTKLSLAPVSYYKCNEAAGATSIIDYGSGGLDLTVAGTVTFGDVSVVPSDSETSVKGDGSTGTATNSSYPAGGPTGVNPWTAICAMYYSDSVADGADIFQFGATSGNERISLRAGNGSRSQGLQVSPYGVGGLASPVLALQAAPHLLGVFYDGNSLGLMIDGRLISSFVYTGMALTAGPLAIIGGNDGYTTFPIGRVGLFAGMLTPKDWALLMQAFTGVG